MVHDYDEHGLSIVQFFESSLAKLWEQVSTGMSNRNHNITGVNMSAWHPNFDRDDTRKGML